MIPGHVKKKTTAKHEKGSKGSDTVKTLECADFFKVSASRVEEEIKEVGLV